MASSLASLTESTSLFSSVRFERQCPISQAVLSSEKQFEQFYIRDAETHELALFEAPSDALLNNDEDMATKRVGPQPVASFKDKASPLKDKSSSSSNQDPQRCLMAAQKLLTVYPLPRANDHVTSLMQQLDGLIKSLQASEDALKQPVVPAQADQGSSNRAAELQELIKREQMEIFAIEQMNQEKRKAPPVLAEGNKTIKPATTNGKPPQKKSMKEAIAEKRAAAAAKSVANKSPSPAKTVRSPTRSAASTPAKSSSLAAITVASPVKSPSKTPTKSASPQQERTPTKAPTPAKTATPKKPKSGLSDQDLAGIADKLWSTIGAMLRPWGRKSLKLAGQPVPSPLESLPFAQTRSAIQAALAATTTEPASPGSLASTAVTNDEEDDPTPPVAQQLVEFELMRLLFDTMSGSLDHQASPSSAAQLPPLTITYRDALSSATKEPMVSMSALKSWLLKFAKERQCSEDLATKAIYSLVSKNVLRIDRRGTAAVGFRS